MAPINCPTCTTEISEGDAACPRCGTSLEVASAAASAASQLPLMSVLNESQPAASPMQVIATRVAAIALVGWLVALAVFAWVAYDEGYIGTLLPLWNTVFVVAMLPLVAGVFARRMWAQRWTLGIAAFTGLGNMLQAKETGSSILWVGVAVLTGVVLILAVTKKVFRHDNAHRGTLAQLLAIAVTIGSIFVYMASKSTGTERGRAAFATEVQRGYE
nr:zinc ribbon domain-containing protein [Deltaproteobacteria bacterium]